MSVMRARPRPGAGRALKPASDVAQGAAESAPRNRRRESESIECRILPDPATKSRGMGFSLQRGLTSRHRTAGDRCEMPADGAHRAMLGGGRSTRRMGPRRFYKKGGGSGARQRVLRPVHVMGRLTGRGWVSVGRTREHPQQKHKKKRKTE